MLDEPAMRILGIETSTRRGSVALLDENGLVLALEHDKPNAHAEALLPLVARLFAETGVAKSSLERVAVGTGPGSFTGLRIGIALGEGIALGIGVPLVGVCSLEALARAVEGTRACIAVLDAGRGELFVAAYAADGAELLAPCAATPDEARGRILAIDALRGAIVVGEGATKLPGEFDVAPNPELALPHARIVAALAAARDPERSPPDPIYVRGAGATLPDLPPSPLLLPALSKES
jgi:tRNA threonylcarbamoyladenosine biosynthesis protein TsaB